MIEEAIVEEANIEEEIAEEIVARDPVVAQPPQKYIIKPVFFAFDSYALSAAAKANLDEIAGLMERFPSLELEITGHTDAIGTFEYNKKLSMNRARAVSNYLVSEGVIEERMSLSAKSESEHVARNRTKDNKDAPDGRKLNRRAQFKVSVTQGVVVEMAPIEVPEYLKIND